MKLNDIQIPTIKVSVRVVAVALAIIGLWFLFWVTGTKIPEIHADTAKIETQNKTLSKTESSLTNLYNNMSFYVDETNRLNEDTEKILTEFPTFMYLEDKILYADTLLKTDLSGYNLSQFNYGESTYIMNVLYGANQQMLELYSVGLSGKYTDLTYTQIKEILDYGLNSPQRFVINQITMGYNEKSGYISGEFTFTTYFIPGQTTPYEFPKEVIDGLGNSDRIDDLFGARQTIENSIDDAN
jgi:hypothetical protein